MSDGTLLYAYGQRSLYGFAHLAQSELKPYIPFNRLWSNKALHYKLKTIEAGESTRLLLNLPFGYHHMLIAGLARVAWKIGHNPSLRILIVLPETGDWKRDVDTFTGELQQIFESPFYPHLFPNSTIVRQNQREFATQENGQIYVTNAMSDIPHYRVDHIISLGAENYFDLDWPGKESRVATWCIEKAFPLIRNNPTSSIVIVNGRNGAKDLITRLRNGEAGEWNYMKITIQSFRDKSYQINDKNGGTWHVFRNGESLGDDLDADEDNSAAYLKNIIFQSILFPDHEDNT